MFGDVIALQDAHWSDLIASNDKDKDQPVAADLPETERKRREAVWELFTSECVFLVDHLMVLKHVSQLFQLTEPSFDVTIFDSFSGL